MQRIENIIEGFCYIIDGLTQILSLGTKRSRFILTYNKFLYQKKFGKF